MVNTALQLTKVRLLEMFNSLVFRLSKKSNNQNQPLGTSKILMIILAVFFVLLMLFSFFSMFATVAFITKEYNCTELYFAMVGIASLGFSVIGSVLASQSYLFEAKDNELLLSMPIPPMAILISRVTSLYVLNLVYSLILTLPASFAYGLITGYLPTGFIFNMLGIFLVPMLSTALCCVLGWLLWIITTKVPFKNFISILLSIIMIAGIMCLSTLAEPIIDAVISNIDQTISFLHKYLAPVYWYSRAVCHGDILSLLLLAIICIASMILVFLVISKFYTKILATKASVKKKKYIAKPMEQKSVMGALIKKELDTILCKPMYLLNCGIGTVFGIIAGVALLIKGQDIALMTSQDPVLVRILGFGLVLALSIMCVINDVSAPSISLEAKTLWILKTMPVDYMNIFIAKALMSPVISLPAIIFISICSAVILPVGVIDIIFMIILPVMCAMMAGLLGVFINLKFPRLDWTSEIAVVKQSLSVVLTMLISMFIAFIPFICSFFMALFSEGIAILIPYGICTVYFAIILVVLYILLKTNGRKTFAQL